MRTCLSEERLFSAALGEARAADEAHVQRCLACRSRVREWRIDLDLLRGAFEASPPRARHRLSLLPAMAVAAVLTLVVGGTVAWWSRATRPQEVAARDTVSLSPYVLEVSSAVFDLRAAPRPRGRANDLTLVTSALFF